MSKDFKQYQLKSSTRPSKPGALLTTVQVRNEHGEQGYCYLTFSDKLVQAVGKKLPRGISSTDPAYLSAIYHDFQWHIWVRYCSGGNALLLWRQATKPPWLSFHKLKEPKNGNTTTAEDSSANHTDSSPDPQEGDTDSG